MLGFKKGRSSISPVYDNPKKWCHRSKLSLTLKKMIYKGENGKKGKNKKAKPGINGYISPLEVKVNKSYEVK